MAAALTALDAAHDAARAAFAAVDTVEDRQAAFELVDQLAERVEAYGKVDDADRRACIRRIYQVEALSLAELADRTGISKSRAHQLAKPPTPKETHV